MLSCDTVSVPDMCPYWSGVDSTDDSDNTPASNCLTKLFGRDTSGSHVAEHVGRPSHNTCVQMQNV